MTKYDCYESDNACTILKTLNELPENTEVVSLYARGNYHYLWVKTVVVPAQESVPVQKNFKSKK